MFVILLTYQKPLSRIDELMRSHVEFLTRCTRAGVFLASGRQDPRIGGVILARCESVELLTEVMEQDPFIQDEAATFEIIQFRTSLHHHAFAALADPGTRAVTPE